MVRRNGIVEADKVTLWVLTDNYCDVFRPDTAIASRYRPAPGQSIHAEHGLAYYLEIEVNGRTGAFMFDYGMDPAGVSNNMAVLGIDLGKTGAFGLSHGHLDHWGGAIALLKQNQARIARGTHFYVGEKAFHRRYALNPGAGEPTDIGQLNREEIEAIGLQVVEIRKLTQIIPGAYLTGNIERQTAYEEAAPNLLIEDKNKPVQDDFCGEQALFFKLKGKGLVLVSGCAHRGIINTVKHVQKAAGTEKVHAILGGFHLVNAKPEVIQSTVADMKAIKPDYIVPTHCTGFEAIAAFAKEMPDEFNLNTAGTKYTFSS